MSDDHLKEKIAELERGVEAVPRPRKGAGRPARKKAERNIRPLPHFTDHRLDPRPAGHARAGHRHHKEVTSPSIASRSTFWMRSRKELELVYYSGLDLARKVGPADRRRDARTDRRKRRAHPHSRSFSLLRDLQRFHPPPRRGKTGRFLHRHCAQGAQYHHRGDRHGQRRKIRVERR